LALLKTSAVYRMLANNKEFGSRLTAK